MLNPCNGCCGLAAVLVLLSSSALAGPRGPARLLDASRATPTVEASLTGSDCCPPAPVVQCKTYQPCVTYRGCLDCCGPKVSQVLMVKDPCDCCCNPCVAEIPVCLPACCTQPCINCKCGLLGRGVVTYSYDCGTCVTIVFRKCGDVIVKYSG